MTGPSQRHGMYGESRSPSTTRHARNATTGATRSGAAVTPRWAAAPSAAERAGARGASPGPRAARRRRSSMGRADSCANRTAPGSQADAVADRKQREQPLRRLHQCLRRPLRGAQRLPAPRRVEALGQRSLAAHQQVVDDEHRVGREPPLEALEVGVDLGLARVEEDEVERHGEARERRERVPRDELHAVGDAAARPEAERLVDPLGVALESDDPRVGAELARHVERRVADRGPDLEHAARPERGDERGEQAAGLPLDDRDTLVGGQRFHLGEERVALGAEALEVGLHAWVADHGLSVRLTRVQDMATVEQQAPTAGIAVENPATGAVIAHVPDMPPERIAEMARRGRAAQPAWEALGFDGRARVLRRAQKWLMDNADGVIETIVSETGKAWEDAHGAELAYGAQAFGFWAKHAPEYLADERVKSASIFVAGKRLVLRYRPLGLVGVIGPWNYPLTNSFGDCIPALAAGNSVLLKPSEITPLTSLLLAGGLRECGLPDDVLQVATGRGRTGEALVDAVDMIMFTGSATTGRKVMARAAQTLTPVALELGGKDPMIVLSDADLERAANAAVFYSMLNTGQTCISIERVYVEAPVYDAFVAKVTEKARALRHGPPAGPGSVEVGSMTHGPQVDIVERHVEDAKEKGARVLVGGHREQRPGHWFEPTVLADVDHRMEIMREETFGPTLPIMRVADADEAVRLANDSPYGLGASVFAGDPERGEAIARRLESGAVCVNDALVNYSALELPMGGTKSSGMGYRHGPGGIRKFTQHQALLVSKYHLKRDVHMYPYRSRTSRLLQRGLRFLYGRGKRE